MPLNFAARFKIAIPILLTAAYFVATFSVCMAQKTSKDRKTIVLVNTADTTQSDTTKINENAPLDISNNRGLFIIAPDGKLQLRILGSVRYLVVYDELNMNSKNDFNTFEIQTGDLNNPLPNYYNGLNQTRLGFEVTRKTNKGDVFIRLESDFAGTNGYRIRHAYGQYNNFILGQTWSLFSHVNAMPATVDFAGPTGSVITRTPQIRYSIPGLFKGFNLALGLEYLIPNLSIPDSLASATYQLMPDFTVRLDKVYNWGSVQFSGILPVLSGRNSENELLVRVGWGISASTVVNSWKKGSWYFQGAVGGAITRYFNDLSNNGLDILISPDGKIHLPLSFGFYGTYEHRWKEFLYSNFTYGWVQIEQYSFTQNNTYKKGHTLRVNTFWDITEGAKIGLEAIWGNRVDRNIHKGDAIRINLLAYYDF